MDQRAEILQTYAEQGSVKRTAQTVGCRTTVVSEVLAEEGVKLSPGGRRSLDGADESQVAERYLAGRSLSQLASTFAVSVPTIRGCLRRQGVAARSTGRDKFWTVEQDRQVGQWLDDGASTRTIAERLGVQPGAVSRALRRIRPQPARTGPDSPTWRGGRIVMTGGYVGIRPTEDDLRFCDPRSNGYVAEHRLVAARFLGRKLLPSETVHHLNGQSDDNRLENLQIRQGNHGRGVAMKCQDCGSVNVEAVALGIPLSVNN